MRGDVFVATAAFFFPGASGPLTLDLPFYDLPCLGVLDVYIIPVSSVTFFLFLIYCSYFTIFVYLL